jgi:hypothetical protein
LACGLYDAYETQDRSAVIDLYRRLGLESADNQSFNCEYCNCNRACFRGQPLCCGIWPYVGVEYGAAIIRAKRTRILFIAMDRGSDGQELKFTDTQEAFRKSAELRTNWHMGGVALIMAALLDHGASDSTDACCLGQSDPPQLRCPLPNPCGGQMAA